MKLKLIGGVLFLGALSCAHAADVTRGFINSQGGTNTVMTINRSGVYPLSSNYTGEIDIAANDVVLDLNGFVINGGTYGVHVTGNNVVVRNGSVRGAGIGVQFDGNDNRALGLDLIANGTAMRIASGQANIVQNCTASSNTNAGFVISGGQKNMILECSAADNGSNGYAYGFISINGSSNAFQECVAQRTQTTGTTPFYTAAFALTGTESNSRIERCTVDTASAGTSAYGIYLESTLTQNVIRNNTVINVTGTGFYDAAGNASTNQIVSNFGSNSMTNYNIGTIFPISAAKSMSVGEMDNIDASLSASSTSSSSGSCGVISVASSTTISTAGSYCLSSNVSGNFLISGDNVSLDLSGHVVTGGTIGIQVTGNNALIENGRVTSANVGIELNGSGALVDGVDLILNGTGLRIYLGSANIVRNCYAINSTYAGYSLRGAVRNSIIDCSSINSGSNTFSYGFVSTDGKSNVFDGCEAKNVSTSFTSTQFSLLNQVCATGFALTGTETQSTISNCSVYDVAGTGTYGSLGYGIAVTQNPYANAFYRVLTNATGGAIGAAADVSFGANWAGNIYWALIDAASDAAVTKLNTNSTTGAFQLTRVATSAAAWTNMSRTSLQIGSVIYFVGLGALVTVPQIYKFDCATETLSLVTGGTVTITTGVNSAQWLTIGTSYYLAFGGASGGAAGRQVSVAQFDPVAGTLSAITGATFSTSAGVNSVDWLTVGTTYYLVMASDARAGAGNVEIQVFSFNPTGGTLALIPGATVETGQNTNSASWLTTDAGSYYLSFFAANSASYRVYQFNPTNGTLASITSVGSSQTNPALSNWLSINSSYYLIVPENGGAGTGGIVQFDPVAGTLTSPSQGSPALGNPQTFSKTVVSANVAYFWTNPSGGTDFVLYSLANPWYSSGNNLIIANQVFGATVGYYDYAGLLNNNTNSSWSGNYAKNNTTNYDVGTQYPVVASNTNTQNIGF